MSRLSQAMPLTPSLHTIQDLRTLLNQGKRGELVAGRLIELPPHSRHHALIGSVIAAAVYIHTKARSLGEVSGADGLFRLVSNPDTQGETVRIPDVSFVSANRHQQPSAQGIFEGAPDLVVKVITPEEHYTFVRASLRDYFAHGTLRIWVIDPESRIVEVFTGLDSMTTLSADSILEGGEVLPGFSLSLTDLFAPLEMQ